jgi:hypothetical protein
VNWFMCPQSPIGCLQKHFVSEKAVCNAAAINFFQLPIKCSALSILAYRLQEI